MGFASLFFTAVGLSMDAFSAAVCKGLNMRRINYAHTAMIAAFFGGFQALMPLIGWVLGKQFERYIVRFDHWIAFFLLSFIGSKMLYDTVKKDCGACGISCTRLNIKELLLLSVATSIDALAVGVTFAFLQVNIWLAIALIGVTTFILSAAGVLIGNWFGSKYKNAAQIFGGVILILIGIKILIEHLFLGS